MTGWTNSANGIICLFACLILLSACACRVPLTARMSQTVMVGVKPGPTKKASYTYVSHAADGEIRTCGKGDRGSGCYGSTYLHDESSTLEKMLREYLSMKSNSLVSGPVEHPILFHIVCRSDHPYALPPQPGRLKSHSEFFQDIDLLTPKK